MTQHFIWVNSQIKTLYLLCMNYDVCINDFLLSKIKVKIGYFIYSALQISGIGILLSHLTKRILASI